MKKWSSSYKGDSEYHGNAIPLYSGTKLYIKKEYIGDIGATIWNTDDENLCAIIYAGLLIETGRMELMNPYAVLK